MFWRDKYAKVRMPHLLVLHKYLKPDGSFDYQRYRRLQTDTNKANIQSVWVQEENIAFAADYIRRFGAPKFGICHGTRRGLEQTWFRKYLNNCEVIGTEISDTAAEFAHTIQWDFHDTKPEWIDAVDFIYSNSFDHSYDPEKCLNAWMRCVRPGGVCIIEHSSLHSPEGATEVDPFGADISIMPYLILTWARGKYWVRELLETPRRPTAFEVRYQYFVIIQRA
jgi:Methyltransferase domain